MTDEVWEREAVMQPSSVLTSEKMLIFFCEKLVCTSSSLVNM